MATMEELIEDYGDDVRGEVDGENYLQYTHRNFETNANTELWYWMEMKENTKLRAENEMLRAVLERWAEADRLYELIPTPFRGDYPLRRQAYEFARKTAIEMRDAALEGDNALHHD